MEDCVDLKMKGSLVLEIYDVAFDDDDAASATDADDGESIVPDDVGVVSDDCGVVPDGVGVVPDYSEGEEGRSSAPRGYKRSRHGPTGNCNNAVPSSVKRSRRRSPSRRRGAALQELLVSPTRLSLENVQLGEGLVCREPPSGEGAHPSGEGAHPSGEGAGRERHLAEQEETLTHAGFAVYEKDVYLHKRSMEISFHPVRCLHNQPEVTLDMRSVLVDWLTKLCRHFTFGQDTLFLAVNIMDRFLYTTPISRDCFQLLGITTFLIAAKQEEVNPPEITDLVRLCCHAYHRDQVKQLELIILNRLRFDLLVPTPQFFLEYYCATRLQGAALAGRTVQQVRQTRALGRFIQERCLQNYDLCQFQPSLLALSTLEVCDQLLEETLTGRYCGGHSPDSIDHCARRVRGHIRVDLEGQDLQGICEKYMDCPYNA